MSHVGSSNPTPWGVATGPAPAPVDACAVMSFIKLRCGLRVPVNHSTVSACALQTDKGISISLHLVMDLTVLGLW